MSQWNKNELILMGRVYNIKPSQTKNGKDMTFFTVTTYSDMGEDSTGEKKDDKPLFHPCVAYGKTAALIATMKEKDRIWLSAKVDYYKDKDDVTRTQIVVVRFEFVEEKSA